MIIFKPTRGIVRITKLDYDLISFIFSRFIITKRKVNIRVEKSRYSFSYYCDNRKIICINTDESTSLKFTINTLLHEIRHYMQMRQKCDGKDIHYADYTSYWNYYSSPKEKDARKFEKITTEICKIYNQYKIIEEKFKRYELDYFMELCYNEAVDSNDLH